MKINWFYIKMVVVVAFLALLYGFAEARNKLRRVDTVSIRFEAGSDPFLTDDAVNKLLIQNKQQLSGQAKETLDLKVLEDRIDTHPMVYEAEVYLALDGEVNVFVVPRKPIARVAGEESYYLDELGEIMPLSKNYSARVPLVSGVGDNQLKEVNRLLRFIGDDAFLKKQVVGIHRRDDGEFVLQLRATGYDLVLGKITGLQSKFSNYKAFFQKAKKENTLNAYKSVDIRFKGQVVGIKS